MRKKKCYNINNVLLKFDKQNLIFYINKTEY